MIDTWSADDLGLLEATPELEISTTRADGTLRRWLPIWVVTADGEVYVRTWHRRDTGWYGHAVRLGRARVRAHGLECDVHVHDVGVATPDVRTRVDAGYRTKYGDQGSMTTDEAARSTLRLTELLVETQL